MEPDAPHTAARWPKKLVRDTAASTFRLLGLTRAKRALSRLTVVTFHRVLPREQIDAYPFPDLCVTPEELDWFVRFFAQNYECSTFHDAVERHVAGTPSARPRLAITFDDGQLDNAEHAAGVLARHSVAATFFIPVDGVERGECLWHDRLAFSWRRLTTEQAPVADELARTYALGPAALVAGSAGARSAVAATKRLDAALCQQLTNAVTKACPERPPAWARLMTAAEVRGLAARGHEIGSHSMSHSILPNCTDLAIEREVQDSKRSLEAMLEGRSVTSFCYPNGDYDDRCIVALERAGYRQACTTRWGDNEPGTSPFTLRRFDMNVRHVRSWHGKLSKSVLSWRMSRLFRGRGA